MQTRLRNYLEDLQSFQHNIMNLGMHNPGRYAGFDTLAPTNTLVFSLFHTNSGISYKTPSNQQIGPCGVVLSQQGVLIMEDGPITGLSIDTNAGNNATRFDLVILTHDFTNVDGGQAATYSIIKGAINNPIKPILSNPSKQVAIGFIEIPGQATNINQCTYEKFKCPDSGDGEDARLSTPNTFSNIQQQQKSAELIIAPSDQTSSGNPNYFWTVKGDSNVYEIQPNANLNIVDGLRLEKVVPIEGTKISLLINEFIGIRSILPTIPAPYNTMGYFPIIAHQSFLNYYDPVTANKMIKADTGTKICVSLLFYNSAWVVLNVEMKVNGDGFVTGDMCMWFGNIATNFDTSGLGLSTSKKFGWAICNGRNGTPDLRGRYLMMATEMANIQKTALQDDGFGNVITFDNATAYQPYGVNSFGVGVANLPNYNLTVTDPGHKHDFTNSGDQYGDQGGSYGMWKNNSDIMGTFDGHINPATTGIQVNSGGSGKNIAYAPAAYAIVVLMKL